MHLTITVDVLSPNSLTMRHFAGQAAEDQGSKCRNETMDMLVHGGDWNMMSKAVHLINHRI